MSPTVKTGPLAALANGDRWCSAPTGAPFRLSLATVLKSGPPNGIGCGEPALGANGFGWGEGMAAMTSGAGSMTVE